MFLNLSTFCVSHGLLRVGVPDEANKYQPNLILSIARSTTGELLASAQVVRMQSWTEDMKRKIPNASPIARSIELRTEFSGACTAEFAVQEHYVLGFGRDAEETYS